MMKRDSLIATILTMMIFLLAAFSQQTKQGAEEGLMLCEKIIIPSLLPTLIITNIITKSRCTKVFEKLFGGIIKRVFNVPKGATTAIIFSQIAGYPAGAIMTENLYKNGEIDEQTARRMMRYCCCGGVAFLITAVGTIHLNSTIQGVIIYLSNILASIIIAIMSSNTERKLNITNRNNQLLSLNDALIQSVDATTHSVIVMCGYIILFSAIMKMVPIPQGIVPLIEITNGIMKSDTTNLPRLAFYLAFGGICIHMQIMGMAKSIKMKYTEFLLYRIINATLSSIIAWIMCRLIPQSDSVFSNISQKTIELTQVNTKLSIVLIIGCVVIIFDVENRKYKLI